MLRSFIVMLLCVALPMTAANAQASMVFNSDSQFLQIDRHAGVPDRVRAICDSPHPRDFGALIKEQDAFADSVEMRDAPASAWFGLACRRALLFAMGAPGREGPLMPPGTSWVRAAVAHLEAALALDPGHLGAAQLLAAIGFEVVPVRIPAGEEREADRAGARVTLPPPIVPRLAGLLYHSVQLGATDPAVMRACVSLMFDAGDIAAAHDCSMRALAFGSDSTWHLLRLAWLAVIHHDTTAAKQHFRAAAAAAHDPLSRAEFGWHLESPCRAHNACSPIGMLDFRLPMAVKHEWLQLPDSLTVTWFDAQLAKAALGDTTKFWRGETADVTKIISPIRGGQNWSSLVRHLVTQFSSVAYAGSTFRSCEVFSLTDPPCAATLAPSADGRVDVIAQVDHVWDPLTGAPIILVPYAIAGDELVATDSAGRRAALLELRFHRWGSAGVRDTALGLSLLLPSNGPKHPTFTGYLEMASVKDVDSWSFMVSQSAPRHGGVYQEEKQPLDNGPLVISDLVLGMPSEGLFWVRGDRRVALAPQDVIDRKQPVTLYFQVKSATERAVVRTTLRMFAQGADRATTAPALQIGFDEHIRGGLNEVERELTLSKLKSGRYWLEVELVDKSDQVVSRRAVVMYLK